VRRRIARTRARQLPDREGLGDVVVRPQLQAHHLVDLLAARGQHHDRLVEALAPQRLADLEPRELGQHDVEDHEVGLGGARALQAGDAVGGGQDLVALELEVVLEAQDHVGLVFDD
jgi:hypothetical protein